MTAQVDQLTQQRSRLLYPGFVFSLALNLLFIGGTAAAIWHHHNERMARSEPGLLSFVRELPAARQDAVRNEITAARESLKTQRDNVRTAWINANDLLLVEPFDKDKFRAAMATLRGTEDQYKTGLNNAMAETAAGLSLEERKLLHSWRETRRPRLLGRDKAKDK